MTIVPYEDWHADRMDVQPMQRDYTRRITRSGDAWTALDGEVPIACAGLLELWTGRAMAWALLSRQAGPHLFGIVKAIQRKFSSVEYRRIEMYVRTDFAPGCHLARVLGFELEGRAKRFLDDGRDAFIYARAHG